MPPSSGGALVGLLRFTWINACREFFAGVVSPLTRVGERHVGIDAKRKVFFPTGEAVLENPSLATRGRGKQQQAAAVIELLLLLSRLGVTDRDVSQCHVCSVGFARLRGAFPVRSALDTLEPPKQPPDGGCYRR